MAAILLIVSLFTTDSSSDAPETDAVFALLLSYNIFPVHAPQNTSAVARMPVRTPTPYPFDFSCFNSKADTPPFLYLSVSDIHAKHYPAHSCRLRFAGFLLSQISPGTYITSVLSYPKMQMRTCRSSGGAYRRYLLSLCHSIPL